MNQQQNKDNPTPPTEPDLGPIIERIKKGDGFVMLVGILTNKLDEKDNRIIEFEYKREHFSFEDTKEALKKFKEHFHKDIMEGLE